MIKYLLLVLVEEKKYIFEFCHIKTEKNVETVYLKLKLYDEILPSCKNEGKNLYL